jgi:hypothetical protein
MVGLPCLFLPFFLAGLESLIVLFSSSALLSYSLGHDIYKMSMYCYRNALKSQITDPAAMSQPGNIPHRTALLFIRQNEDVNEMLRTVQNIGLTVMGWDRSVEEQAKAAFPDMMGMSDAQIAALPDFVKYYKCSDKIETGDPGCGDNKYNDTLCVNRKAKASWHPGWKDHALVGRMISMTYLEQMQDAIENMVTAETAAAAGGETDQQKYDRLLAQLNQLNQEEANDYNTMFAQPVPELIVRQFQRFWADERKGTLYIKKSHVVALINWPAFGSCLACGHACMRGFE